MRTIPIRAGSASYEAYVGSSLLETIGEKSRGRFRGPRCAIVADSNTHELFAEKITRSLTAAGFTPITIIIPAGENSKSLEQAGRVCGELEAARLDRTSFIVALGGGVAGDLAGFAAAIYRRGIPVVQVPTTLLAQVDSAIGGKTAVNTSDGKNLLGAIHQPAFVLADVDTLRTLPPRELRQGFAEIIKHGIIADPTLFDLLGDSGAIDFEELVARNIAIKAEVVARDEHDVSGTRAVLNFGHTVGHAIELAAGYGEFRHGEAVSLGLVAACEISVAKAGLPESDRARIVALLSEMGLPTALPPDFPREKILAALQADKKFERGEVRFVVSSGLGSARLTSDVTPQDIHAAVAKL